MRNASLYWRFIFGFALILGVGSALVVLLLWLSSVRSQVVERPMTTSMRRITALGNLDAGLTRTIAGMRAYILGASDDYLQKSRQGRAQVNSALEELRRTYPVSENPEELRDISNRLEELDKSVAVAMSLVRGSQRSPSFRHYLTDISPRYDAIQEAIIHYQNHENAHLADLQTRFRNLGESMKLLSGLGIAGALAVAVLLAFAIAQTVIRPVKSLAELASDVAAGNYAQAANIEEMDSNRHDERSRNEVVQLSRAFVAMVRSVEEREMKLLSDADIRATCLSTIRLKELMERVLPRFADYTGSCMGIAYVLDEQEMLRPVAGYAVNPELLTQPIAPGEGLSGQAVKEKRPIVLNDIPDNTHFTVLPGLGKAAPKAMVCIPLIMQEQVLGVVSLAALQSYSQASLDFLNRAMGQVSVAASNAAAFMRVEQLVSQLQDKNEELQAQNEEIQAQYHEIRKHNELLNSRQIELDAVNQRLQAANQELTALQSITSVALSSLEMDELLNQVLGAVTDAVGADMGCIFLLDEDGRAFKVQAFRGFSDEDVHDLHISSEKGLLGLTAAERGVIQFTDAEKQELAASHLIRKYDLNTAVGMPLISDSRLLGMIQLFSRDKQQFTDREIGLLEVAADRITTVIERINAFNEMQTARRHSDADRRRLEAILDNMPEGVIITSAPEGKLEFVNKAAKALCSGFRDDITIPEHPEAFGLYRLDGELFPAEELPVSRSILNGETVRGVEILVRHPDGKELVVLANSTPVYDDQGKLISAIGVFQDITVVKEAEARQRRIADMFQQNMLPEVPPRIGKFRIAMQYKAAAEEAKVGGDFYDIFEMDNGKLGIAIGDVSGKGLDAAVQTAMVKYSLRSYAITSNKPSEILNSLNKCLCWQNNRDSFITLFFGILDLDSGIMEYTSAGHEPPALATSNGDLEFLAAPEAGIVLGVQPDASYSMNRVHIRPGDTLLLYTDGLTETRNGVEFLNYKGIEQLLRKALEKHSSPEDIIAHVFDGALQFSDIGKFRDDIALLLIQMQS